MNEFPHYKDRYTPEIVHKDYDKIREYFKNIPIKDCKFFDSHEGCLLRCIYVDNDWIITTHKRLKAFESRWSSRFSFGEIFRKAVINHYFSNQEFRNLCISTSSGREKDILTNLNEETSPIEEINLIFEIFIDTLDKSLQHFFFVRNNHENYIVCDPPEKETVYYAGSCPNAVSPQDELVFDSNIKIPLPAVYDFTTVDDIIEYMKTVNHFKVQGLIVYIPRGTGFELCKIVHSEYLNYALVRNNEPSIRHRYLALRTDSRNTELIDKLCYLYPHYISKFDRIEYILSIISNSMYKAYVDRYIKRKHVVVPKEEYKIMKECFDWYMADNRRRISRRVITNILNKQPTQFLSLLIKKYSPERRVGEFERTEYTDYSQNQGQERPQPQSQPQPRLL